MTPFLAGIAFLLVGCAPTESEVWSKAVKFSEIRQKVEIENAEFSKVFAASVTVSHGRGQFIEPTNDFNETTLLYEYGVKQTEVCWLEQVYKSGPKNYQLADCAPADLNKEVAEKTAKWKEIAEAEIEKPDEPPASTHLLMAWKLLQKMPAKESEFSVDDCIADMESGMVDAQEEELSPLCSDTPPDMEEILKKEGFEPEGRYASVRTAAQQMLTGITNLGDVLRARASADCGFTASQRSDEAKELSARYSASMFCNGLSDD